VGNLGAIRLCQLLHGSTKRLQESTKILAVAKRNRDLLDGMINAVDHERGNTARNQVGRWLKAALEVSEAE
jgi:hypothetical protein